MAIKIQIIWSKNDFILCTDIQHCFSIFLNVMFIPMCFTSSQLSVISGVTLKIYIAKYEEKNEIKQK